MNKSLNLHILIIFPLFSFLSYGQNNSLSVTRADTFFVNFSNNYKLSSVHVIPLSEELFVGSVKLNPEDYHLDLMQNSFKLADSLKYSIFDTIIISYQSYDLKLKRNYQKRELIKIFDEELNDRVSIVKSKQIDLSSKGIFGKNLRSSGTLLRGFSLGTNKDLTVNSGLRLQLEGRISDDIEIVAALTDENTPIQPEGNTERLEELDKVFIEIKHKNASGVFGDYNYNTKIGEFGRTNRKLQGALGTVRFEDYGGSFAFAASRGKFNSMSFNGIDGVQGPYRLLGADNENDIIIIAGSEKVYLDGTLMKRGENNDYVIEYSNGELTFTPKILITELSRIIIDFEYTSRQYERNIIGANGKAVFFDKKLKIQLNVLQEGDNKNNPIDLNLSESDKNILKESGDDKLSASVSGAVEVESDSLGVYSAVDTLFDSRQIRVYKYEPGSANARFNVSFSFVGANNGDYKRESIGKYVFVGSGQGSYLPIRLIPLPERSQIGNLVVDYSPIEEINLNLEFAASSHDANIFSDKDEGDNNGYAGNLKLNINPFDVKLFEKNLGNLSGSYRDRYIDKRFRSIDRINEIEFNRNYNTSDMNEDKEVLREIKLNYLPVENIRLFGQYGFLRRGNNFTSERVISNIKSENYNKIDLEYNYDFVGTDRTLEESNWLRQNGKISYSLWQLKPGFEFRSENKEDFLNKNDSLLLSSQQYHEYSPFLLISFSKGISFSAKYSFTKELAPENGIFIDESKTYSHSYSLIFREYKEVSSDLDFSFRKKKFSEIFALKGFGDNESIQIRSQNRFLLFNRLIEGTLFYQTSSERSAKLERVFLRVPKGTGSFKYLGDTNNNGIAEENEFVPDPYEGDFIQTTVPTDELFPVIDLKFNTRWKLDFKRYFKSNDFFSSLMGALTSETSYRVEEKSRISETEKIYLLNFNYFLQDSTTIRGFNFFQQDLHIWKNQRDLSFRFRFTERQSLNQYSSGAESSYSKLRSIKMKFRMVKEINNETEYINEIENVAAPQNSNRSRYTASNKLTSDFSYRPYDNFELGFGFSIGRLEDTSPDEPTVIDENKLTLRFTLSLLERGRLRVEAERAELLTNSRNFIPFEITNGNLIGKNYIWRANFDYRFSSNLQSNISYLGRLQGKGKVINTLTAEARAYF